MAAAIPFVLFPTAISAEQADTTVGRAYAEYVAREQPELLVSVGMSAAELAGACDDARSLEESVKAGWISAAEQRFIEARATREDLLLLGHAPDEIDSLLAEQQACASSS